MSVELIPHPDGTPVEYVEINLHDPAQEVETATWYRVTGDRTARVRGAIDVYAAGGAQAIDQEAPFTGPITYRAELFDANGLSLGFTEPADVELGAVGTRIHHPLDPNRNVKVQVMRGTADELAASFDGDLVRPSGRTVPLWLGQGRNALQGVPFRVFLETDEENAAMESIFGSYDNPMIPIVCIRSSLKLGVPQPFFALVRKPSRAPHYWHGKTWAEWDIESDEVAPPVEMIHTALLTYADVEASFSSYEELESAYLTYFDIESDLSLAGTA